MPALIKRTIRKALEVRGVRTALGFGLAAGLPVSIVLAYAIIDSLIRGYELSQFLHDGAMLVTMVVLGLFTGLIPTIMVGVPLCLGRGRLGSLGLPVTLITAGTAGCVMTRIIRSGPFRWSDYVAGILLSIPSAEVFWWFVIRPTRGGQQPNIAFQPSDSAVTSVAQQRPRHPAGG